MSILNLLWIIPLSVMVGIFINHLSDTLPRLRKITFVPICISCNQSMNFINYVSLKNCPKCNARSQLRKPILTTIFIITYVLLLYFPPEFAGLYLSFLIIPYLFLVFIIDLEHRLILHPVSIFGAILFGLLGLYLNGWKETILGGGIGFISMFTLYLLGLLFSKWVAKRRGEPLDEVALGYGDVNLTGVLGLLFGWPRIAVLLFFAIMLGGIFSGIYMLLLKIKNKYDVFTPIPYAPFLIISALILLYLSTSTA